MSADFDFIVLEGIDGSGTTTQAQLLGEELARNYPRREVLITREPSHTPVTGLIRRWLSPRDQGMPDKAMCMAFALDRYIHIRDVVQPALARGAIVICDRYKLSTLAYQTQTLPIPWVHDLCMDHIDPLMYVLLDVPVGEAMARVMARGTTPDRYEAKMEYQARVAKRYGRAIEIESHVTTERIDAGGLGVLEVHGRVREAVRRATGL
jgi:dTMP kinase